MTDLAPPKFLECPRCGAVTFTRVGVQKHDADHLKHDTRDKYLAEAIRRLDTFLAAVEFEPDATGHTQTFADWMTGTDDLLETLTSEVEQLKNATPANATPFVLEAGEWPTDVSTDVSSDDAPTDEDAGLAAVDTADPTIAPDDDLEDPTTDDLDSRAAAALNTPITYGQTGVIA